MDDVMLAAFMDEMLKIAASNEVTTQQGSALGAPAPVPSGTNVVKTIKASTKSPTKPTNYSVVHNQSPVTATGTASGSKAVPPPPVRA